MVSVTAEYALCERCGQEQGLRHTNCDTNESSFVCGACGWSWEIAIHRFGADELKRLAVLLAQNPMAWGEVDQVLDVLVRSCEQRCPAIARRWGVSEPTLYRWRDQFLDGGKAALASGPGQRDPRQRALQELEQQLAERDQVIGELTIANRIFKKVTGQSP